MRAFVREEIESFDVFCPYVVYCQPQREEIKFLLRSLKEPARERGLWAVHLVPKLGGQGYG
jgi:hypothetical protein